MSSYFTVPLFARARKTQDKLRKSNPQVPVLKEDDERFLERQISSEEGEGRIIFHPEQAEASQEETSAGPRPSSSRETKAKRKSAIDLPSQEEAEAITHHYHQQATSHRPQDDSSRATTPASSGDRPRTWASYLLPSIPTVITKKDPPSATPDRRTWTQYATSYIPSSPRQTARTNGNAAAADAASRSQQESEIAVLLAQLNTGTLNNRVFALSADTQELYRRFALALRDTMTGVPTAYDDMETLMREAGPTLEAQWKALPPFVQTLVRSLPAKLSTALAPELLAAVTAGEKLGADGVKVAKGEAGEQGAELEPATEKGTKKSRKRRMIPGLKSLMSKEGALVGMLRGTVEFVKVRFPFLASMTNVVLSLAVFILMFVCWYCHKRGKEVRLAKAADGDNAEASVEGEVSLTTAQYSDSDDGGSADEDLEVEEKVEKEMEASIGTNEVPHDVPMTREENAAKQPTVVPT